MGCDKPAPYPHMLRIGSRVIETNRCPRKRLPEVAHYLQAWQWREKGGLQYLYRDSLPAKVGNAIDFIDAEMAAKQERELSKGAG